MKKTISYLLILITITLFTSFPGRSQIISTIAGNGNPSYSGDGDSAIYAELNYPSGIAIDDSGNIFIADNSNNRIRKINSAGIISTYAGSGILGYTGDGGLADTAELKHPSSVAVDDSGNVYVADYGNNVIRKINPAGIITRFAGSTYGFSGDGGPATSAQLNGPTDIALDGNGDVYVTDCNNKRIRKVNSLGIISTVAGGGTSGLGDGGPATSAELTTPTGICFDSYGNLYIADFNAGLVRKVNSVGIISTFAGGGTSGLGDGGPATLSELGGCERIKFDNFGNAYISDAYDNRVRVVVASGYIYTFAGDGISGYSGNGGLADSAEVYAPGAMDFDNAGNLYFTDNENAVIRRVTKSTVIVNNLVNSNYINIYPSPTSGILNINMPAQQEISTLTIYDLTGQVIMVKYIAPHVNEVQINLDNLSRATYLLKVQNINFNEVQKIILE